MILMDKQTNDGEFNDMNEICLVMMMKLMVYRMFDDNDVDNDDSKKKQSDDAWSALNYLVRDDFRGLFENMPYLRPLSLHTAFAISLLHSQTKLQVGHRNENVSTLLWSCTTFSFADYFLSTLMWSRTTCY